MPWVIVFKEENYLYGKQLLYIFEANHIWAYIALVILASMSYLALLCWLLFVSEEDVTEQEGGFFVDIDE